MKLLEAELAYQEAWRELAMLRKLLGKLLEQEIDEVEKSNEEEGNEDQD